MSTIQLLHAGPHNVAGNSEAEKTAVSQLPHVLFVIDQFPKVLGGGERVVLRLASLLPQYGYRVSILTFYAHPESPCVRLSACPIYVLPLRCTYDWYALQGAVALRRFLRSQHIQIVQTFFESSDLWAGLVTKVASTAKLIWSRRDMGILRSSKHRAAYKWMASLPDAVFAVSDQVRQHCIQIDHLPAARVTTIYNGIQLEHWSEFETRSPRLDCAIAITTIGNIRQVKGHDIFIKAAALVVRQFPQATFYIVGSVLEPDYFDHLQDLVQSLGLSTQCYFSGATTDLQQTLRATDVFVLPSRSEGFSNTIIEAMAASLPVVATNVGGNGEAVKDGDTGYVVPVEDPEALAAAILKLISNPAMAVQMGHAGRRRVEELFTSRIMMTAITGVYEKLLGVSALE